MFCNFFSCLKEAKQTEQSSDQSIVLPSDESSVLPSDEPSVLPSVTVPNGVSVHYLKTQFLREVKETEGLNVNSTIHEIEDLRWAKHGVIRSKGASKVCPQDKRTVGAAYSDCLIGDDNVGLATFMLSYTWNYRICDIIDTLVAHCESNKDMDQKRTYVWICCLCNNQHRVYEDRQNGGNVPFDKFHEIFRTNVVNIGHVVAMMFPWDNPQYLTRVWCVFEAYTATTESGCTLTIAMPPKERHAMMSAVVDISTLFRVLADTMIQEAEASVPEDREKILKLVEDTVGYTKLNHSVNELIRRWVMNTLVAEFEQMNGSKGIKNNHDGHNQDDWQDEKLSRLCYNVGSVMYENGEYDEAMVYLKNVLKEKLNPTVFSANVYNEIGLVFYEKGDYENALVEYRNCLEINSKVLGPDHPLTATSYNNIGGVYYKKGDFDNALVEHRKALKIRLEVLGPDHPSTAISYNSIGMVYYGKGDYKNALVELRKALEIRLKVRPDHPDTAISYNNIGLVYHDKGDYDNALVEHRKALEIQLKVRPNHPSTAATYSNIGNVYVGKGDYDNALVEHRKALKIRLEVLGPDHPSTATSYNNFGHVYHGKGDYENALVEYRKCLEIQLKVQPNHPSTALSYHNIGMVYDSKGDDENALAEFRKCLEIQLKVQPNHPSTAGSYSNIGMVYYEKGDYENALVEHHKALDIQLTVLGADHPDTASSFSKIGAAYHGKGDYDTALVVHYKALEIRLKVLGPNHSDTIVSQAWINYALSMI
jgi:tetratricopeptide (TPR) repeat protein